MKPLILFLLLISLFTISQQSKHSTISPDTFFNKENASQKKYDENRDLSNLQR